MHFRGSGVGHKSTCRATDKFLKDQDNLDLKRGQAAESETQAAQTAEEEALQEDDGFAVALAGEAEEEEDDYGYQENELAVNIGDEGGSKSDDDAEPADDALSAEDGKGAEDETVLLGFADL